MNVKIMKESGFKESMVGLSLSFNQPEDKMFEVARRLAFKTGGHNKFLESIAVWLDITAPRYFWQQFDTYRVGTSKQSESTMHTITKRPLKDSDFEGGINTGYLQVINRYIGEKNWHAIKRYLPESFLQRRVVCTNYMVLQNMIRQRETHRLPEWHYFIDAILKQVLFPMFLKQNKVTKSCYSCILRNIDGTGGCPILNLVGEGMAQRIEFNLERSGDRSTLLPDDFCCNEWQGEE